MENTDRAYAAGLLDGEGSVSLALKYAHKGSYKSVVLTVNVTNTFFPVLEWLKDRWGGSVHVAHRNRPQDWKVAGMWVLASASAAAFLRDVQPFVIIKRAQVDNALAFQATKRGKNGSRAKLTEAEWAVAADFLTRQRELNARGPAKNEEVTR